MRIFKINDAWIDIINAWNKLCNKSAEGLVGLSISEELKYLNWWKVPLKVEKSHQYWQTYKAESQRCFLQNTALHNIPMFW